MENVTLVKMTSHDLYKAIKNYLHNEIGLSELLSRDRLEQIVDEAVTKRVDQLFNNDTNIVRIIERKIAEVVKSGSTSRSTYNRQSLEEIIVSTIKTAVREQVTDKLSISVNLKEENTK